MHTEAIAWACVAMGALAALANTVTLYNLFKVVVRSSARQSELGMEQALTLHELASWVRQNNNDPKLRLGEIQVPAQAIEVLISAAARHARGGPEQTLRAARNNLIFAIEADRIEAVQEAIRRLSS